jgi:hypothetical protein
MAELKDYSGAFDPSLQYQDFSKETLERLITEYCRLGFRLDGAWWGIVKDKCGPEVAMECEKAVWASLVPFWQTRFMKALNIQGNDVATYLKTIQMDPQMCFNIFDIQLELKEKNHGTLTIKKCHAVKYYESIDDPDTLKEMCNLDFNAFKALGEFINPAIKVETVKVPPRESQNDICCQFDIKLEPDASTA